MTNFAKIPVLDLSALTNGEDTRRLAQDFREAYGFGGSLHCSTTDVYREGDLQDYFPKQ